MRSLAPADRRLIFWLYADVDKYRGMAVQVELMTVLQSLGTQILILKCGEVLPSLAFNFNLRRYTAGTCMRHAP